VPLRAAAAGRTQQPLAPEATPVSAGSDEGPVTLVKVVVVGGFGAGKTTFVRSASEIPTATTEIPLTAQSLAVEGTTMARPRLRTTAALDFGRATLDPRLVVYLYGMPGQRRLLFAWDELTVGALGFVVVADPKRLEDCVTVLDLLTKRDLTYLVAVNSFGGRVELAPERARSILKLPASIPVVTCDARDRNETKHTLARLVAYGLDRALAAALGRLQEP
jgi:uncharacterized protein